MRRNLIAGLLIATGLALAGSAFWTMQTQGSPAPASLVQMLPSTDGGGALLPRKHQNPIRQAPAVFSRLTPANANPAAANEVIATLTIPRLAIFGAPIFDRGLDSKGSMLIAHGYAVTHYANSAGIGIGNAVLYGHDDIEGSIFARLKDLQPGDEIDITVTGRTQRYRVSTRVIVAPTAVQILDPTSDVRLTLFTCWPNWVDTQRVVVTAFAI